MSFLQPWMLFALPLLALPVAIHLIHRRRHRAVAWGAMMFLLEGIRMSRGMQRVRHVLLLLLRTAAVASLILGLARPLAGGWIAGVGGARSDVVLVLLDRSASMSERAANGGTKLEAGLGQIAEALASIDSARLACIDSVGLRVTELASPDDLRELPSATPTDARADVPGMVEVAAEHLRVNAVGRADIWILSDGQSGDWRPEDGRWPALQQALLDLPAGVRVNVLQFADRAPTNLAIRVDGARVVRAEEGAFLSLDLRVKSVRALIHPRTIPVAIDLGGARSVVEVELAGTEAELHGHLLSIDSAGAPGWGYVEIPADANSADNRFFFTYGLEDRRETVVVCESEAVGEVMRIAAEAPVEDAVDYVGRITAPPVATDLDLDGAAMLVWQAPLPEGQASRRIERFLDAGGQVLFLPPERPSATSFLGCSWGPSRELAMDDESSSPSVWRHDADLLRDGQDGTPLSVDALEVRRLNPVSGDVTPLASFADGEHLLMRAPTEIGGAYFLGTTPSPDASNLAVQGVVLVAMIQRALTAAALGQRGMADAGEFDPLVANPRVVSAVDPDWLLSEHLHHAGVVEAREGYVALNRSLSEDASEPLGSERLLGLMPDVDVSLVLGTDPSVELVDEIWRVFLGFLLIAIIGEALLCITESAHSATMTGRRG